MEPIAETQYAAAARTLAAAFAEDPFFVYMVKDPTRRASWTETFMHGGISLCPPDCVFVTDSEPKGVVALYSPGSYPPSTLRNLVYMVRMLVASISNRLPLRRLWTISKVLKAIDAAHPDSRCWYMLELGVLPAAKGQGLGGALTHHALNLADADGLPVYLETTNHDNLGYYRHFGFELVGTIEGIGDAPPVWRMLRPSPASD